MSQTLTTPLKATEPVKFNPLVSEYVADPHPQLHRLRAEDPVHWCSTLGVWVLTRYADIVSVLRDDRFSAMASRWEFYNKFFLRGGSSSSPLATMYTKWMLQLDSPDHTRIRGLVNKAFTPRVVENLRPKVQAIVDDLIDRVIEKGEMEAMTDFAFPLPIRVISALLGAPEEDYEQIRLWTQGMLPSLSPAISVEGLAKVGKIVEEYIEYFRRLLNERKKQPKDDMLSALLHAHENGERLSEEELLANCILIAFAGHVTTAQLTGTALHQLLETPDQLEKLRNDPSLIGGAIEETLRYDSMLQMVYRTTKQDVEMHGKVIPANSLVFAILAAANRDPAMFPDPDRFDITRNSSKHIAFGYGAHFCVGAPLARLEGQVAVNTVLRRLPDLRLNSRGIRREPSLILRGLTRLPLTFRAGG
jgi:cytochrome P450